MFGTADAGEEKKEEISDVSDILANCPPNIIPRWCFVYAGLPSVPLAFQYFCQDSDTTFGQGLETFAELHFIFSLLMHGFCLHSLPRL